MNYDEPSHTDDRPIEDDCYPYSRCSGPGPDDDFAPDDELPDWLQRAIEQEEERLWIEELARQHEAKKHEESIMSVKPKTFCYHFNLCGSRSMAPGDIFAQVVASSPAEAVRILRENVMDQCDVGGIEGREDGHELEYVTAYINPDCITDAQIDEVTKLSPDESQH